MTKELKNKNLQNNETENLSQVELQVGLPFKFTHLDLFSGIGGFALAAKRTWGERYQNVGFCEIDEFCHKVLKKNFGNEINIIKDISELNGEKFRSVKLITGGFPCQPFSRAGNQLGKDDERYLWEEMLRVCEEAKPGWIVAENVDGIINLALDRVVASLEDIQYKPEVFIIPASAVGMQHRRDRVWIIAYPSSYFSTFSFFNRDGKKTEGWNKIQKEWCKNREFAEVASIVDRGIRGWQGEFPEPKLVRIPNGLPGEVDRGRIKALGNAIVPQVAEVLLAAVKTIDDNVKLN